MHDEDDFIFWEIDPEEMKKAKKQAEKDIKNDGNNDNRVYKSGSMDASASEDSTES